MRKGPRKGERYAKVSPEVREPLELLGRERALIYKRATAIDREDSQSSKRVGPRRG